MVVFWGIFQRTHQWYCFYWCEGSLCWHGCVWKRAAISKTSMCYGKSWQLCRSHPAFTVFKACVLKDKHREGLAPSLTRVTTKEKFSKCLVLKTGFENWSEYIAVQQRLTEKCFQMGSSPRMDDTVLDYRMKSEAFFKTMVSLVVFCPLLQAGGL